MTRQKRKERRTIWQQGSGTDRIRVLIDARRDRCEVKYRDGNLVARVRTFTNTKEGRAEAEAWAVTYFGTRKAERARRASIALGTTPEKEPTTILELWREYAESPAFTGLRPSTRENYEARFRLWMADMTPRAVANETTMLDIDRFQVNATKAGLVLNTVRQVLNVVRIVYNWGQSRRLISTNDMALHRWKQPKDLPQGVVAGYEPGEFTPAQMDLMISKLSPQRADQWRGWVALMLARHHGQRANALRHIRVEDFHFTENVLHWDRKWQKQGRDVHQPITWAAYSAYLTAMYWRGREAAAQAQRLAGARVRGVNGQFQHDPSVPQPTLTTEDSPWLIFAQRDKSKPVSYSSLHHHLIQAESKAGLDHEKYKALHGMRRGRVGEVIDKSGDRLLGLEAVGDTDIKMLKSYDRRRQDRIDSAFQETEDRQ